MPPTVKFAQSSASAKRKRTKPGREAGRQAESASPIGVHSCVAILLATKNGERFLREQLESFKRQTHRNWVLWVSDDDSVDGTRELVEQFSRQVGRERVTVLTGPGRGCASNFLSLTCNPDIEAEFFSYSDQDDIWEADKLARAVEKLKAVPAGSPAMYCSRSQLVDESDREIGLVTLWPKPPSFANALIQNIAAGHTIVLNRAACNLLREAGAVDIMKHDWWCYQLITGCGGTVVYDPYPSVRYRQHQGNSIGAGCTVAARISNILMLLNNRFSHGADRHIASLKKVEYLLTWHNRQILDRFAAVRKGPLMSRLLGIHRCGLYRQTWGGNFFLVMGAILNKI